MEFRQNQANCRVETFPNAIGAFSPLKKAIIDQQRVLSAKQQTNKHSKG
jgi:hypothetical protein